jgi:hypothetical protein
VGGWYRVVASAEEQVGLVELTKTTTTKFRWNQTWGTRLETSSRVGIDVAWPKKFYRWFLRFEMETSSGYLGVQDSDRM